MEVSLQLFEKARILVDKSFSRILAMRLVKDGFLDKFESRFVF